MKSSIPATLDIYRVPNPEVIRFEVSANGSRAIMELSLENFALALTGRGGLKVRLLKPFNAEATPNATEAEFGISRLQDPELEEVMMVRIQIIRHVTELTVRLADFVRALTGRGGVPATITREKVLPAPRA